MNPTPISLLEQLRGPAPGPAWDRFVHIYTPLMYLWAGRLGSDGPDADDLVQDVFAILVEKLPEFLYDPGRRFRGWLWTVLVNKARERGRRAAPGVLNGSDLADPTPGPAEEVADREYRDLVVRRALDLIRHEFEPTTWNAFWDCVTTDRPAAEIAARLDTTPAAVYQAKSRVLRRLRQDLDGLLD
jgi:RNA polymerase sigma-70 factor (ECF subfamily)